MTAAEQKGTDSGMVPSDADNALFDTFLALVQQKTQQSDWPLAYGIEQDIPLYAGDRVREACRQPDLRKALLSEWVRLLSDGPGIVVIKNAYNDTACIDTATDIFENIITQQRQSADSTQADHFAKAGANDRIWNALEKHARHDADSFVDYYGNEAIALVCHAWLGRGYQVTAQVNRVNPGGAAQSAHRDYHLGFMTPEQMAEYPPHVHLLSPVLTLQGAIAHCDMPLDTGPTLYLPYSQQFTEGYVVFSEARYQAYFDTHRRQLPLSKGDAVFFNPAVMHAAGENRTSDSFRLANLLQVSSAMGRATEQVNREALSKTVYPALLKRKTAGSLDPLTQHAAIAATAEGYAFPTNLDTDPPVGGLAPMTQAELLTRCLDDGLSSADFEAALEAHTAKRR